MSASTAAIIKDKYRTNSGQVAALSEGKIKRRLKATLGKGQRVSGSAAVNINEFITGMLGHLALRIGELRESKGIKKSMRITDRQVLQAMEMDPVLSQFEFTSVARHKLGVNDEEILPSGSFRVGGKAPTHSHSNYALYRESKAVEEGKGMPARFFMNTTDSKDALKAYREEISKWIKDGKKGAAPAPKMATESREWLSSATGGAKKEKKNAASKKKKKKKAASKKSNSKTPKVSKIASGSGDEEMKHEDKDWYAGGSDSDWGSDDNGE